MKEHDTSAMLFNTTPPSPPSTLTYVSRILRILGVFGREFDLMIRFDVDIIESLDQSLITHQPPTTLTLILFFFID